MNNSFENNIRDAFDGFEATAPESVLSRIKETVASKQPASATKPNLTRNAAWTLGVLASVSFIVWGLLSIDMPSGPTSEMAVAEPVLVIPQPVASEDIREEVLAPTETNTTLPEESTAPATKLPALSANAGDDLVICGLETSLETQLSNPSANGLWEYEGNDNRKVEFLNSKSASSTIVKVAEEGSYTFRWTETLGTQASSDEKTVEFVQLENIHAGQDVQVCGNVAQISSNGISGNWTSLQNCEIGSPIENATTVETRRYGKYQFVWTESRAGCFAYDTVEVDFVEVPIASIQVVAEAKCFGDVLRLQAPNCEGVSYLWNFGSAKVEEIEEQFYGLTWDDGGSYKVELKISNHACNNSTEVLLDYPEKLSAKFLVTEPGNKIPALVYFSNLSSVDGLPYDSREDVSFVWDFGNGETSSLENPEFLYTHEGIYFPKLEMRLKNGCKSVYSGPQLVVRNLVEMPDKVVITPNGDGKQDYFSIDASGFKSFSCTVLSVNGKRIHTWSHPEGRWDGKLSDGSIASEGTYPYVVKATTLDGAYKEILGVLYLYCE